MRFDGEHDTCECENCGRRISHLDALSIAEEPVCSGCWATDTKYFLTTTMCEICKKPLGSLSFMWDGDGNEEYAHKVCVKKLSKKKQEYWTDEW